MNFTYEKGPGVASAQPLPKVIKASRLDTSEDTAFALHLQARRVRERIIASGELARAYASLAFAVPERWGRE